MQRYRYINMVDINMEMYKKNLNHVRKYKENISNPNR